MSTRSHPTGTSRADCPVHGECCDAARPEARAHGEPRELLRMSIGGVDRSWPHHLREQRRLVALTAHAS
jgi:hypothetical protein